MAVPQPTDQGQDDATGQPHQQRDPDLPEEDLPHVGLLDRAGREPADDQGRGLQTDVAAHGGDDGNKADDRYDFLDREAEQPEDRAGNQTADQVGEQPRQPQPGGGDAGGFGLRFLLEGAG